MIASSSPSSAPVEPEGRRSSPPRTRAPAPSIAGVVVQRPAAALRPRNPHLAAVLLQHLRRRHVRLAGRRRRRRSPRNSATRARRGPSAGSTSGSCRSAACRLRQHLVHLPQRLAAAARQRRSCRPASRGRSTARAGPGPAPAGRATAYGKMWNSIHRCSRVQRPRPAGPVQLGHVLAERLDQLAVLHAGRAGRLARPAVRGTGRGAA